MNIIQQDYLCFNFDMQEVKIDKHLNQKRILRNKD